MTCRAHREAILDLARGMPMPDAAEEAASAHVRSCAACAAELDRQRDLSRALQVLSTSTPSEPRPELEERLLAAFPSPDLEPSIRRASVPWLMAAAAALIVVAGSSWILLSSRRSSEIRGPMSGRAADTNRQMPVDAVASQKTVAAAERSGISSPPSRVHAARPLDSRKPGVRQGRSPPRVRDIEFLAIPTAIGLPPLESATIVRTELPLSALPDYGLQIHPNAAHAVLEADLLVGQDGLARGIRLVTAAEGSSTSRSRQ
jgi:hypothetical protein